MQPNNEGPGFIARWVNTLFIIFVIVPLGLTMQYVENSRREARIEAFEEGDFYLVVLREKDDDTEKQIVDAVRDQCTLHSVQTFEDRELLRVECDRETLNGLPVPRNLEKFPSSVTNAVAHPLCQMGTGGSAMNKPTFFDTYLKVFGISFVLWTMWNWLFTGDVTMIEMALLSLPVTLFVRGLEARGGRTPKAYIFLRGCVVFYICLLMPLGFVIWC